MIECKNCKSTNTTKNGKARRKQRYKCKDCGYNFVIGHAYYTPQKQSMKALAVMLYALGKGSYRMLGKIFGVSNGTIGNWVKEAANGLPEAEIPNEIKEMEFDEMWHYIGKKNGNYGLSRQLTEKQIEWLRGYWENVTKKLSNGYMTK
jgi:transposase-like protein